MRLLVSMLLWPSRICSSSMEPPEFRNSTANVSRKPCEMALLDGLIAYSLQQFAQSASPVAGGGRRFRVILLLVPETVAAMVQREFAQGLQHEVG
jgi:hypothetical protein